MLTKTTDPYTGAPLLYLLRKGEPLIYAAGCDRDDDGARQLLDDDGAALIPKWLDSTDLQAQYDGDWILYPPQE